MIIITNIELLVNLLTIICYLFLSPSERLSYKVIWLHGANWEVEVILCDLKWIKWKVLGLV